MFPNDKCLKNSEARVNGAPPSVKHSSYHNVHSGSLSSDTSLGLNDCQALCSHSFTYAYGYPSNEAAKT